jgi:hypothetical protein
VPAGDVFGKRNLPRIRGYLAKPRLDLAIETSEQSISAINQQSVIGQQDLMP